MEFSLSAAAKATSKGKSTIHNAVKSGKLSARRTEAGTYIIDASELARVFPLNPSKGSQMDDPEPPHEPLGGSTGTEVAILRTKLAMLEDQLAREREMSGEVIADLRSRLNRAEERTYQLTYQAQRQSQEASSPVVQPQGLLGRLLGLRRGSSN